MNIRPQMIALVLFAPSVFLFSRPALSATPPTDYCQRQLPVDLQIQLSRAYPGYRAPRSTDNLDEDVTANLKNSGTGCLAVAGGAFTGSGKKSLAIALTALQGDGYIVVIAGQRGQSWIVSELIRDSHGRQRLYIAPTPAGHYDHVASYEPDTSKGELAALDCPHPGVVIGATEATGDVYCVVREKWEHLPIVD